MHMLKRLLSTFALLALAACGGGGGNAGNSTFGSGTGGGTGGATPTVTLQVTLLDSAGAATSNILAGQPVRAQAILRRNGEAVANEIVQFTADQGGSLVRIDPTNGSQLTDGNGSAVVTISSLGTASGAGRITATASVGGVAATSSANFFASSSTTNQPPTLTLSALEIGSQAVSAYGTTGVRVRVLQGAAPYTAGTVVVNFTSSCPAGKATITASANTQPDGYAVGTFVDNGCAPSADSVVTLTASIATDTKSGTMTVRAPTTGSLRFISVVPSDKSITLRGQGGNGRQENATVTFQLVDVAGQGVPDANVCFDSSTYIGGLNLDGFSPTALPPSPGTTALCGTDSLSVVRHVKRTNADGTVTVVVNSGSVPTPVRVRARALYPATATLPLESFSDTLSVSTGLPLQRSFSLSADKTNIDGGTFDGEIATLTVRLADQFSNPVPDGTVVNFIGSGAAVCTANNGSCRTTNGACSCNVVSQARRPQDNRVVVLAYAVGLEDYDDLNGDNLYSAGIDGFRTSGIDRQDLGDAFVDSNKDGIAGDGSVSAATNPTVNGDTDILVPYQVPGRYSRDGDGSRGTAHIRASAVIYLSMPSGMSKELPAPLIGNSQPLFVIPRSSLNQENSLASGTATGRFVRLRPICPQGTPLPQATLTGYLEDGVGNPMASGTSLSAADPSDNVSTGGFRPSAVPSLGARPVDPRFDLPNVQKTDTFPAQGIITTTHSITVRGVEDKCSGDGAFSLQVTSPRGSATSARILTEGDTRTGGRGTFDVRFRDPVSFFAQQSGTLQLTVIGNSWVGPLGGPAASAANVNCGNGLPVQPVTLSNGVASNVICTYPATGNYSITYTVTAGGESYQNTISATVR